MKIIDRNIIYAYIGYNFEEDLRLTNDRNIIGGLATLLTDKIDRNIIYASLFLDCANQSLIRTMPRV